MSASPVGASLAPDPILVLGAPRSGTTYLQSILASHPEVAITNEVRLFAWLHRALLLTRDDLAVFEQRAEVTTFLRRELPTLVRRYFAERAPHARWWGDKNPHYAWDEAQLQTVAELFPGARFVHIVRDPRAVIASLLRKQHGDGRPWIAAEDAHVQVGTHVASARRFGASVGPDRFREVRWEDLVADDEAEARALFDWLGIPFAPEVEQFCRQQRRERTAISGPTSDLERAGDPAAGKAAWAATIAPRDQRKSLQFLAPFLLASGYETPPTLDAIWRTLPEDA